MSRVLRLLARRCSTRAAEGPHLVVLIHGLHGEATDLSLLHHSIATAGQSDLHVLSSTSSGDQTDGIDAAGARVAAEIQDACRSLGSNGSLSVVAHSNGGLIGRWALGQL
jgi:Predicted acetyltransferases and hydrolases with the alpha/beta hydrolase fold